MTASPFLSLRSTREEQISQVYVHPKLPHASYTHTHMHEHARAIFSPSGIRSHESFCSNYVFLKSHASPRLLSRLIYIHSYSGRISSSALSRAGRRRWWTGNGGVRSVFSLKIVPGDEKEAKLHCGKKAKGKSFSPEFCLKYKTQKTEKWKCKGRKMLESYKRFVCVWPCVRVRRSYVKLVCEKKF